MRDMLGAIYDDEDFAQLFEVRGRPAKFAPWRLALVTVMQFAEGLSDRQATEAVHARIDRKYALGLELTDLKASTSPCSRSSAYLSGCQGFWVESGTLPGLEGDPPARVGHRCDG